MKHNRILFNFELLSFGNNNIIEGVEDEVTLDFLNKPLYTLQAQVVTLN